MDTLQFISSLVQSLAWPISAVGIAYYAREPLVSLIRRTDSAEGFGVKATFRNEIEFASDKVDKLKDAPVGADLVRSNDAQQINRIENKALEKLGDELALTSAVGSIVSSWLEIEEALKIVSQKIGLPWDDRKTIARLTEFKRQGVISSDLFDAITTLRRIRNEVTHARGTVPSLEDANSFRSIARDVVDAILIVPTTSH